MYTTLLAALMVGAPPQPASGYAPLLHVRLAVPDGVRVTLRPGTPAAKTQTSPVTFAVRPGYVCRLAIAGMADEPSTVIYPTLEVRSSLFMPVTLQAADFPATVRISEDDLKRVLAGGMVTKVIYVENPETAPAEATSLDYPLERDAVRGDDALEMARLRGRVLAILRIGGRVMSPNELMMEDIAGTVQLPGDGPLGPPARPPVLAARTFQLVDPISGPRIPTDELLPDGGDTGLRIGIGPNGHLGNLDVTDTAAEFRYAGQARRTTTSNRICLFAPRFGAIRQEMGISSYETTVPAIGAFSISATGLHRINVPAETVAEANAPMAVQVLLAPRGTQSREGVHELDLFRGGPLVLARIEGLVVHSVLVEPAGLTQYRDHCKPNEPLVLVKTSEPQEAKPGDMVTITLKFINYGSRAARDLIVSDSLASRLEYVAGSSRGDRPTVFTQRANEAGSTILRWEVTGELPAGQSGVVQFQARVR